MQKNHEPYSAATAIKDIVTSDKYLEVPRGMSTTRAIAKTALALADYDPGQNDEVYRDEASIKQIIIGLMPDAYESQTELSLNRDTMHPAEVGRHLDKVVDYNHALRELVDHKPKADFRDIMQFVTDAAAALYADPRDVNGIVEQTRMRVDGMRHEVAAEAMFWSLPNVADVRSAKRDEDKRGIDIVVEFEDGHSEGYDIKASKRGADEANQKAHHPKAVWSGLDWEDFDGKLRIDMRELNKHLPKFERELAEFYSVVKSA